MKSNDVVSHSFKRAIRQKKSDKDDIKKGGISEAKAMT